jgi:hypothetical protein
VGRTEVMKHLGSLSLRFHRRNKLDSECLEIVKDLKLQMTASMFETV